MIGTEWMAQLSSFDIALNTPCSNRIPTRGKIVRRSLTSRGIWAEPDAPALSPRLTITRVWRLDVAHLPPTNSFDGPGPIRPLSVSVETERVWPHANYRFINEEKEIRQLNCDQKTGLRG